MPLGILGSDETDPNVDNAAQSLKATEQGKRAILGVPPTGETPGGSSLFSRGSTDEDTSSPELASLKRQTGTAPTLASLKRPDVPLPTMESLKRPDLPTSIKTLTLPEVQVQAPEKNRLVNFTNFLVGGEMSVIGASLDAQGFHWSLDQLKNQWAEQPLWLNLLNSASLVGTVMFPAFQAAKNTYKYGMVGKALGLLPDTETEIANFKGAGLLDPAAKNVSEETLLRLRKLTTAKQKYADMDTAALDMTNRMENGESINPITAAKITFNKQFANGYYKLTSSPEIRNAYHGSLDKLWKNENLSQFFIDIPGPEKGKQIYMSHMHEANPELFPKVTLDAKDQMWAERMRAAMERSQKDMLDSGAITPETYAKVGKYHIPAINKDTPIADVGTSRTYFIGTQTKKVPGGFTSTEVPRTGLDKLFRGGGTKSVLTQAPEEEYVALRVQNMPRLDSPNLLERKSDLPTIYNKLVNDKLITDPAELTVRGYVEDQLIHHSLKFVRDVAVNEQHSIPYDTIAAKYLNPDKLVPIPKDLISLNKLPNSQILQRMIEKAPDGRNFLGPNGELPYIRKAVFDQIASETGLFAQAQHAVNGMEVMTAIHKTAKTGYNLPTHFQNGGGNIVFWAQAGMNPTSPANVTLLHHLTGTFNDIFQLRKAAQDVPAGEFFSQPNKYMKGVDLGKIKINGVELDLNKELFDPVTRELIEDSAFDAAEGSTHLNALYGRLAKDQILTRGMIKAYMKVKNVAQLGGKFKWMDGATKAYAAEDIIPKMGMFLNLRAQGLTRDAAVLEVGRRMPMYATVGSAIQRGRKVVFPWATFPTEALRITKNNLIDNPIGMLPWLHMPGILQSLYYELDPSYDYETAKQGKSMLPFFAQNPYAVVGNANTIGAATGGVSGAVAGTVAGAAVGGPVGAAVGAAAGGVGGYMLSRDGSTDDGLRAAILNFLPHSSFNLKSNSPDYVYDSPQAFLDQLPAEPLAILRPLLDVIYGRGPQGQDIKTAGPADQFGKVVAGLIGFMSPPLIQKYGFKTTGPDVSFSNYLGSKTGILPGGIPGDPTNVAQLLQEGLGYLDPNTGKPGNFTYNGVINNLGAIKSYAGDPATKFNNEQRTDKYMQDVRDHLAKNLDFNLKNGQDAEVMDALKNVMATFSQQYAGDGYQAQTKFNDWLKKYQDSIWQHPKFRHMKKDQLLEIMGNSGKFAAKERGNLTEKLQQAVRDEITIRGSN